MLQHILLTILYINLFFLIIIIQSGSVQLDHHVIIILSFLEVSVELVFLFFFAKMWQPHGWIQELSSGCRLLCASTSFDHREPILVVCSLYDLVYDDNSLCTSKQFSFIFLFRRNYLVGFHCNDKQINGAALSSSSNYTQSKIIHD
jgi:hypothetical protein